MITLSVDVMGGDHGPASTLPACLSFLRAHSAARLLLVGLPAAISPQALAKAGFTPHDLDRLSLQTCSEVVAMDDPIEVALRKKRDSSLRVAVEQVKNGAAHAAVSAGNTGALMAIARFVLKTLDGIDRPAIATALPNVHGQATTVLDLGANVDCTPEHLVQFALMGQALAASSVKPRPSVGLLNIGEEVIKGNEVIKQTGVLLRQAHEAGVVNFYGNVEGNDIFKGTTDVVVCDGFVGNVALKASEGVAGMMAQFIREGFERSVWTKLAALLAYPVIKSLKQRTDHRRYNGAALLGLRGLVFKSHGSADAFAFEQALRRAYAAAHSDLLGRIEASLRKSLYQPVATEKTPA